MNSGGLGSDVTEVVAVHAGGSSRCSPEAARTILVRCLVPVLAPFVCVFLPLTSLAQRQPENKADQTSLHYVGFFWSNYKPHPERPFATEGPWLGKAQIESTGNPLHAKIKGVKRLKSTPTYFHHLDGARKKLKPGEDWFGWDEKSVQHLGPLHYSYSEDEECGSRHLLWYYDGTKLVVFEYEYWGERRPGCKNSAHLPPGTLIWTVCATPSADWQFVLDLLDEVGILEEVKALGIAPTAASRLGSELRSN